MGTLWGGTGDPRGGRADGSRVPRRSLGVGEQVRGPPLGQGPGVGSAPMDGRLGST